MGGYIKKHDNVYCNRGGFGTLLNNLIIIIMIISLMSAIFYPQIDMSMYMSLPQGSLLFVSIPRRLLYFKFILIKTINNDLLTSPHLRKNSVSKLSGSSLFTISPSLQLPDPSSRQ